MRGAAMAEAQPTVYDIESAARLDAAIEVRVWLRLLATAAVIEKQVRNRLAGEFETTLPRFDALAQLERAPDGLSMGDLSRRMMVSNGNVTRLVDRLVSEGLVERRADPSDRRAYVVCLTDAGRANFAAMAKVHHEWIRQAMGSLDKAQLRSLYEGLGALKASAVSAGAAAESAASDEG